MDSATVISYSDPDGAGSQDFAQNWTLDGMGNWSEFKQNGDGQGSWDLDQTRQHNAANEIDNDASHADTPDPGTILDGSGTGNWARGVATL
jgi:hypothetical protein